MNGNVLSPAAEEACGSLVKGSADLLLTAFLVPLYLSLSQARAESGVTSYEPWNDRHQNWRSIPLNTRSETLLRYSFSEQQEGQVRRENLSL